jgi:hypothetical protein
VTVDGYWIDNQIYCTLQPSTTESLRTPSALQFTTEYIATTLQSLYPPQPLFWHPLPTLSWFLPNSRFPSFLSWPPTHSLTNYLSGIYDLWTDCREDTFSERKPFLGTDSKETSISRYQVTSLVASEASRSVHVTKCFKESLLCLTKFRYIHVIETNGVATLTHIHISPPPEVCDTISHAAHYHILGLYN